MACHTEKDLESKTVRGKKSILQPGMSIQKEGLESKPKQIRPEKGLFLGAA